MNAPPTRATDDWLTPVEEEAGLRRYFDVLSDRRWIVALTTLLALVSAIAYLLYADPTYEGEAELLITPVAENDPATSTLGLLRESTDPARDVETAARLATTRDVAERVADQRGVGGAADELLEKVDAAPVAQSNVVVVTAEGSSPQEAARLANAFAEGAVAERTQQLHRQIRRILRGLEEEFEALDTGEPSTAATELSAQLARLRTLANADDPTVRVETEAEPPEERSSPKVMLTIVAGLVGGLLAGIALAYLAHALDRRLRHEDQLRRRYRLPILARIPKLRHPSRPLGPSDLPAPATEGYRTLRSTVLASRSSGTTLPGEGRVVLVTGAAPGDGKTTTAINLATSLALSGRSVIVIESDLRRPMIGAALGLKAELGVVNVLIENATLEEALVDEPRYRGNLKLLLAEHHGAGVSELLGLAAARNLIAAARELADFVIVDSPPLATVIDALPLAREADDVLIVVRIGSTPIDALAQLAELLQGEDITPTGFVLLAAPDTGATRGYGYYYGAGEGGIRRAGSRLFRGGPNGAVETADDESRSPGRRRITRSR